MTIGGVKLNAYSVISALVALTGAIMLFANHFSGVSVVVGSILAGLGVFATVFHVYLSNVTIPVPAGVYNALDGFFKFCVIVTGAGTLILQYLIANAHPLALYGALILGAMTLFTSLFSAIFVKAAAAKISIARVLAGG